MRHSFFKKLTALLLGMIMVFSMIPAIAIGTHAADSETMNIYGNKGTLANKVITWTSDNFTFSNAQGSSTTAIRTSDSAHYRIYAKSTVTVSALNGNLITKITMSISESKYTTPMVTSINNNKDSNLTVTGSGTTVTVVFADAKESLTFTASAQTRITNITVEFADVGGCDHSWVEDQVITAGDCTTDRVVTRVCELCGEPGTNLTTPAPGHSFEGNVCSVCGETVTLYELVTDVSKLKVGDSVIIVGANGTKYYALSTTQSDNNRPGVAVTVDSNGAILPDDSVQILTLGEGKSSNTFAFDTGSGYLYAASSGSNHLKTEAELSGNSSWAISIDATGKAIIKAQGENTRNWLLFNTTPLFSAYANTSSNVKDTIYIYKAASNCTHANTEPIGTPSGATCTEDGITAGLKCSDCDEVLEAQQTITAPGHIDVNPADSKCDTCGTNLCTEHVWVQGEVITEGNCTIDRVVSQVCNNCGEPGENIVTTAPGHTPVTDPAEEATCTKTGLTEGTHCGECNEIIVAQEVVPMKAHEFDGNVCSVCGTSRQIYKKVTSNLTDWSGTYLIVYEYEDGGLAFDGSLETLDATKNTVPVTIVDGVITGDFRNNVFIIGTVDGGYSIMSKSGIYIGRGSDSNGLDAKSTAMANTIALADGVFTIKGSGGPTLMFNADSNQMRFRYYAKSGQKSIALYKLEEAVTVPAPVLDSFSISLNKGVTVRVTLTIDQKWYDANENAKVVFSNNVEFDPVVGKHTYTVDLTPGQIGSALTVTVGELNADVSVARYIARAKDFYKDDTALCNLLDAITVYGMAAARTEQTLNAPDFTGVKDYVLEQTEDIMGGFAEVVLGEYANIGITINESEGYTYVAKLGDKSLGRRNLANDLTDGVLIIENLRPANFNDQITVTIYEGNTVISTITFSFNSYLKLAYAGCDNVLDSNIVTATYNYGVAAKAYLDTLAQ